MSKINIGSTEEKTVTAPVGSKLGKELAPETSPNTDGLQDPDPVKAAEVQTPDNANVKPVNEFGDHEAADDAAAAAQDSNLSERDIAYLKSENPTLSQYANQITDSARPGSPNDVTFSRELQSLVNKYQQHASYKDDGLVSDMQSMIAALKRDNRGGERHERIIRTNDGMTILQRQHGSDSTNTDNSINRPVQL
jgi:hypothetical protein